MKPLASNDLKTLVQQGLTKDELKQFALSQKWAEQSQEYRDLLSLYYERERKAGFKLIMIGAGILIISCLATVVMYHHHLNIDYMMYTSSVIGLGISFWGCTRIL
ncbi:MAG: hypothetical protein U0U66_12450 [Cytophagaceae bacterium]